MKTHVYKVVVIEVDAELSTGGSTPVEVEAARYTTEAPTPWDSILQWASKIEEEECS